MKKIFTLLLSTLVGSVAFAQRVVDVSIVEIVSPSELNSTSSGTVFKMNLSCKNDGPDDILTGDTIYTSWILGSLQNQVIDQKPNGANQGVVTISGFMTRDVIAGDTFHYVANVTSTYYATKTLEVNLIASIHMRNLPDLSFEDQSSSVNNRSIKKVTWFNEGKWPLSTGELAHENVTIYPNPAAENATISALTLDATSATTVRIFNLQGQEVFNNVLGAGSVENINVDASALKNGVYMVQLINGEKVQTSKLVVSH